MALHAMNAVHDRDLDAVLEHLHIKSKIDSGRMKCASCGTPVSRDTIGAIFYRSGQAHVICSEPRCIDQQKEGSGS